MFGCQFGLVVIRGMLGVRVLNGQASGASMEVCPDLLAGVRIG